VTRRITASWSRKPSTSRGVQWLLLGAGHRDRGREHPCAPGLYAIWSAVGIALVAVFGEILVNDPAPPLAVAGMS